MDTSAAVAVEPVVETATEVVPSPAELAPVRDLCERALYLQAHAAALRLGPLAAWRGTEARVLAGRLAAQLGAPRLSGWHFVRAFREQPDDPDAALFFLRRVLNNRGPLAAWTRLQKHRPTQEIADELRARWLNLEADVLGQLRDFDAAEACLSRAERLAPQNPSVMLERADLLSRQDRHAEALDVCRQVLALKPWYRPAVLMAGDFLSYLGRDDEVLALLTEATKHIESAAVWARIAALQMEQERFAEAVVSLDEHCRMAPMMEPALLAWVAGRRADCAYGLGDRRASLEHARQARGTFWKKVVERLEKADLDQPPPRRVLQVGFIGQHHQTCAPATLASLCQFWQKPEDHLEVAEAIAYDGTPSHSQRRWAEEHGWVAREFTVTWDNARALIDRGVPFAVTTVFPRSAHLQAVVGYDALRGTLFLRDPSERHLNEVLGESFLEHFRSVGPRGMALVPADRASLLDGLDLLDAELYDHVHRLRLALDAHDRDEAVRQLDAMRAKDAGHRMTFQARRMLAGYDGDPTEQLEAIRGLLKLFPDDQILLIAEVDCLRDLARRDERLALVRKLCEQKAPDSQCLQLYARELATDAREFLRTRRLYRRAIRYSPRHAEHYFYFAHLLWDQRRFDEAFALYRFAACLEDKGEQYARSYFRAARCLGRSEEGLHFLRERFARFGKKSSLPARTLARALADLERGKEALAVFDEAMKLRPDDASLMLYAADLCLERGQYARAEELLNGAKGKTHALAWIRHAARLAEGRGRLGEARQLWEQLLAEDPLALDAHRQLVQVLAGTLGREAALNHLKAACERFPHCYDLMKLWNQWLRDDDPAAAEGVMRRLIESHPTSAWAHRELAMHLGNQGRTQEALASLEEAERLEPLSSSLHSVRGFVLMRAGRNDEAKEAFKHALLLDVDNDVCLRSWLRLCETLAERREVLSFIEIELGRQVTFGDALFSFQQAAGRTLAPEDALATLRRIWKARPDLWHAWSALTDQLVHMHLLDEALAHATEAVSRFPLVSGLWVDLARICHLRRDNEAELAHLRRALEISPTWGRPQRLLAEAYERLGRFGEAHAVLERSVQLAPLVAANHYSLGDILWKMGRRQEAVARLQHSLVLDPVADSSWDRLFDWAQELKRPDLAVETARRLTTIRASEPRVWVGLGRALALDRERMNEAIEALDQALRLNPHQVEAYDRKADLLCKARRMDEAKAVCTSPVWNGRPPVPLRLRLAIILAEERNHDEAKRVLRAVLAEDQNSYRAWALLADSSEATKTWDEYREAAENMVRLAPHSSTPYGYRATGKLRTGDRAGAKADLARALHLQANYTWAAFELFDLQLADGELRQAAGTLRHLRRYRRSEFTAARLCQLFAKRNKKLPALKTFRRLCLSGHTALWPMEGAEEACVNARWGADVEKLYASLMPDPRCRPQAATEYARWLEPGPRWETAKPLVPRVVELIDRDIASRPKTFLPHDMKAKVLAFAGRFEDAEAACKHPDQVNYSYMRGRMAWVFAQAGQYRKAVEAMSAVLADFADYSWGWRQLAEWTEKLEDWQTHLKATENMVRLDPKSVVAYGFRGEARLRTGDRAGAKADFRHALTIDPKYNYGIGQLCDLCIEDKELEEAAQLLERQRQGRDDEYVWRRAGRLEVARGNEEAALGWVRKLALSGHAAPWPLQDLHDACVKADWSSELQELYQEVLPDENCRPQVATLWVDLADLDDITDEPELMERAHVLFDRAIAAAPREPRPYDYKALLYGLDEKYEQAEEVCRRPAVAQTLLIRARLAWVLRKRGRLTEAIGLLRSVVAASPNYSWAYYNLMDYAGEVDAWPLRRAAADNYVRLNPNRPAGYRNRGHARRDLGDKAGAKDDFRKAIELDASNTATRFYLFDLLLDVGELDEAGGVLEEMRARVYLPYRLSAESRLAARRGDEEEARDKLLLLCVGKDDDDCWVLDMAVKVFKERGWQQAAEEVLGKSLQGERVLADVGRHWVALRAARGAWLSPEEVTAWAGRGQPGSSVIAGHALALARAGRADEVKELLGRYRDRLREATRLWWRAGQALVEAGLGEAALEWLGDWRDRRGVKPMMIFDAALALHLAGRWDEAGPVHRHAQAMTGDSSTGMQEVWLGLDAALSGNADEARQCLEILAGGKLDTERPYVWLRALIQACLDGRKETDLESLRLTLPAESVTKDDVNLRPVLEAAWRRVRGGA